MKTEFLVRGKPPYKQAPADPSEQENQRTYRQNLEAEARRHFPETISREVRIEIIYTRAKGCSDAPNIIGGIIDSLQGIAYDNDRQVVEIHYRENRGPIDQYSVSMTS